MRGDAISHDRRRQTAHHAAKQPPGRRVAWLQIPLNPERRHTLQSRLREDGTEARSDPRRGARQLECPHHPVERLLGQQHARLGTRAADVEVDRAEQAVRAQVLDVMANRRFRIGEVKQDQASDDGIERRRRAPGPDVTLDEGDVPFAGVFGALACHGQRFAGFIDPDDRTVGTNELARNPGHVSQPGAEIQDAHATTDAGGLEQQARRPLDRRRLPVQPRELRRVVAQDVRLVWSPLGLHVSTSEKSVRAHGPAQFRGAGSPVGERLRLGGADHLVRHL